MSLTLILVLIIIKKGRSQRNKMRMTRLDLLELFSGFLVCRKRMTLHIFLRITTSASILWLSPNYKNDGG